MIWGKWIKGLEKKQLIKKLMNMDNDTLIKSVLGLPLFPLISISDNDELVQRIKMIKREEK